MAATKYQDHLTSQPKGDPTNEVAKDFIDYILSKDGQQVISDNGYISNDDAADYAQNSSFGENV